MNWLRSKKTVAVHSGSFHADDIFSVAVLSLLLGYIPKIIRTRDQGKIKKADFVLDVGGEYDPAKNKFDHHQIGGAGKRSSNIPYATFGLVWKEYGEKIAGSAEAAGLIEKKLVAVTDADDNAFEIGTNYVSGLRPYTVSDYVIYRNSVCEEKDQVKIFNQLLLLAIDILETEIKIANRFLRDSKQVENSYQNAIDKRLIILDGDYDWNPILSNYPEPLFVVRPAPDIKAWKVYAVKNKGEKFKNRVDLPAEWAGQRDEQLARVTGVPDAVYCHHQRYVAIAKTKEGAVRLAELALQTL
jgi:uncharacterized UPF0160 family protein